MVMCFSAFEWTTPLQGQFIRELNSRVRAIAGTGSGAPEKIMQPDRRSIVLTATDSRSTQATSGDRCAANFRLCVMREKRVWPGTDGNNLRNDASEEGLIMTEGFRSPPPPVGRLPRQCHRPSTGGGAHRATHHGRDH